MQLGAGLLDLAKDVSRACAFERVFRWRSPREIARDGELSRRRLPTPTSLVADEGREVRRLGGVVLGEGFDAAATAPAALPGAEAQRTTPRVLKLREEGKGRLRYRVA